MLKFEFNWEDSLRIFFKSSQWEIDAGSYDRISNLGNGIALGDSVIVQNTSIYTSQVVLCFSRSFLEYKQIYSLFLSLASKKKILIKGENFILDIHSAFQHSLIHMSMFTLSSMCSRPYVYIEVVNNNFAFA